VQDGVRKTPGGIRARVQLPAVIDMTGSMRVIDAYAPRGQTNAQPAIDPTKHSSGRTTRGEMTVSGRDGDVEVSYTRTVEIKEVWVHP